VKNLNQKEIHAVFERIYECIDEVDDYTEQFAETRLRSSAVYRRLKQSTDDALHKLSSYILASFLADPSLLTSFLRTYGSRLSGESRTMLADCTTHAPHWIIAAVVDTPAEHTYQLQDALTGEEVILYSPELTEFLAHISDTKRLFITLILFNGVCWQSVDGAHSCRLLPEDFLWYTRSLQSRKKRPSSLTELILDNFLDFFTINEIGAVPVTRTNGEPDSVFWAEFPLKTMPDLPGRWKRETQEGYEKFSYRGTDEELRTLSAPKVLAGYNLNKRKRSLWVAECRQQPEITLCRSTGTTLLLARSRYDFYLALELLKRGNGGEPRELHPDGSVSQVFYRFTLLHDYCPLPFDSYLAPFRGGDDKTSRSVEAMRDARLASVCSQEEVEYLCRSAESRLESMREEQKHLDQLRVFISAEGLPRAVREKERGYLLDPPLSLSPIRRAQIADYLEHDDFWADYDAEESVRVFFDLVRDPRKQAEFEEDPREYAEDLFFSPFSEDEGFCIMNMTLTLLHAVGDRWTAVRTYALEILTHFGEYLEGLSEHEAEERFHEAFIERYSRFVYRSLCRNGFCSLKERPTSDAVASGRYSVQRTELVPILFPLKADISEENAAE
jgi:hypothetical protein